MIEGLRGTPRVLSSEILIASTLSDFHFHAQKTRKIFIQIQSQAHGSRSNDDRPKIFLEHSLVCLAELQSQISIA